MSAPVKKVGRPRKWESDAARKRAYRKRRAAELADPLERRQQARAALADATTSRTTAEAARRDADRWRAKAAAAQRQTEAAERRVAREKATAERVRAERDEARRLLGRKLQSARDAARLRSDPDALLALVAELYAELTKLRKEVSTLRQQAQRSESWPW